MLTIFCTAKPFIGHAGIIQRNAIQSWVRLLPAPEILLMGSGPGYETTARRFGLTHVAEVACNKDDMPLLDAMFETAQRIASFPVVCYLDADILLMSDIMPAISLVNEAKRQVLMTGASWELDDLEAVEESKLVTDQAKAEEIIRARSISPWRSRRYLFGMDYFVFRRGDFTHLPRFMNAGPGWESPAWDNRLIHLARSRGFQVIDATSAVTVVHQSHPVSEKEAETAKRKVTVTSPEQLFSLLDATHVLEDGRIKSAVKIQYVWRRSYTFVMLTPGVRWVFPAVRALARLTRRARVKHGITTTLLAKQALKDSQTSKSDDV